MKESILHYVWQFRLFTDNDLKTNEGLRLEIIDTGRLNTDAGPDFFNAKIRIGNTLWAGNVELHTQSSDWYRHGHHCDPAYRNVVLHVVKKVDAEVRNVNGECIPQLELRYPAHIDRNYEKLLNEKKWIPCADHIGDVPAIVVSSWKNALLSERLLQKTAAIAKLLSGSIRNWEEAFYITLARGFGFGINSQAFQALAQSLPMKLLGKHKNNLQDIEALLFGQAGLIPATKTDDYSRALKQNYRFLAHKYELHPIDASQWKFLRLRPGNFPHVRVAQFAALIHASSKLFSKTMEQHDLASLRQLLACQASEYWQTHYRFAHPSKRLNKGMSKASIDVLLINVVVPFLFYYGHSKQQQEIKDKALRLLEEMAPEQNAVLAGWQALGLEAASAYDSQALLQLKKEYCDAKKCLRCRIGHKVMQSSNSKPITP